MLTQEQIIQTINELTQYMHDLEDNYAAMKATSKSTNDPEVAANLAYFSAAIRETAVRIETLEHVLQRGVKTLMINPN